MVGILLVVSFWGVKRPIFRGKLAFSVSGSRVATCHATGSCHSISHCRVSWTKTKFPLEKVGFPNLGWHIFWHWPVFFVSWIQFGTFPLPPKWNKMFAWYSHAFYVFFSFLYFVHIFVRSKTTRWQADWKSWLATCRVLLCGGFGCRVADVLQDLGGSRFTPRKINSSPLKIGLPKRNLHLPTTDFQGLWICWFQEVYFPQKTRGFFWFSFLQGLPTYLAFNLASYLFSIKTTWKVEFYFSWFFFGGTFSLGHHTK